MKRLALALLVYLLAIPASATLIWVNDNGDGWNTSETVAAADMNAIKTETDSLDSGKLSATITSPATGATIIFNGSAWIDGQLDLADGDAVMGNLPVTQGGTGRATGTTAYALIATGTTATGAQQSLAAGATTEVLVGGGTSALPVWTTATGTGAPVRAGSPALSGTPTAPSAAGSTDTMQIATMEAVHDAIGNDVSGPTDYCVAYADTNAETYVTWATDRWFWRPGKAITITDVWGSDGIVSDEQINLQKCDPSCGTNMLSSTYTANGTAYGGSFVSGENVLAATDAIFVKHDPDTAAPTGGASETTAMLCVSYTIN